MFFFRPHFLIVFVVSSILRIFAFCNLPVSLNSTIITAQSVEELRAAVAAAQRQRRTVASEKARVLSASASVASMREQVRE